MKVLIYDIEIEKAICGRDEEPIEGIDYCEGWDDREGMGVSCVGAWQMTVLPPGQGVATPLEAHPSWDDRPRIFFDDNREFFVEALEEAELVVTFNGQRFDDEVLLANEWIEKPNPNHLDILLESWAAAGLSTDNFTRSHRGFRLNDHAQANGLGGKTGHGALAPVDYQRGRWGSLVDYCMRDVHLTRELFRRIWTINEILDPRGNGQRLRYDVSRFAS